MIKYFIEARLTFFSHRSLRRTLVLLILLSVVDRQLSTAFLNAQVSDTTGDAIITKARQTKFT
jgi:hypothetical protein